MALALRLAYDGTAYFGFQRQKDRPTIQGTLEKVLARLTGIVAPVVGAGRTDAGVHARGQVAVWRTDAWSIPVDRVPAVLNRRLPPDIRVLAAWTVPATFDPRRSARSKTYSYTLKLGGPPDPWADRRAWVVDEAPDPLLLERAARLFVGRHDFRAFRGEGSSARSTARTVLAARWEIRPPYWVFWITGDGFLYHMVRLMVGAMVDGARRGTLEAIERGLDAPHAGKVGRLAPAHGLCLERVEF
ncbi:MAG: tRNA pseudouridine(38-40) synthase TruA [Actinomycetia bacterium]|nr:tRNA pseudouridine(38-40) synthase TruA [Actinomycetes bacterium]